jgi:colanic acid biosynthesis glycosyl transferase WcaI
MRILLLTQWFQPESFFKGLPFAKALRDRGHQVEVLTGFPNYPEGRVYPGYCVVPWQRERMDGVTVNRVALYPSHDRSGFHRILSYASFGLTSAVLGPFSIARPDVVYVYNLVTLGPAALILKRLHGSPVVYDIQDLWPDSVAGSGMMNNSFFLYLLEHYCRAIYSRASHVVTLSPGMKGELVRRGVSPKRMSVIYNWCEEEYIKPTEPDDKLAASLGLEDAFIVMFAGTMGAMQGLDRVLDAAQKVAAQRHDIKFVFVGGGTERERLKRVAMERGLSNVLFLDRQPAEKIGRFLALADVMLVHLTDTPLFRMTIPSKVQAYMAAGKPILLGVRGDAANIIQASGCGKVVEPENAESIAKGVLDFVLLSERERKGMGAKGRKYYEENLSMKAGVQHFEDIFMQVVPVPGTN